MNLFKGTSRISDRDNPGISSLDIHWVGTPQIQSSCPVHIGTRLIHVADSMYQCPLDKAIFKNNGSVANQTGRDNYYIGLVLK